MAASTAHDAASAAAGKEGMFCLSVADYTPQETSLEINLAKMLCSVRKTYNIRPRVGARRGTFRKKKMKDVVPLCVSQLASWPQRIA